MRHLIDTASGLFNSYNSLPWSIMPQYVCRCIAPETGVKTHLASSIFFFHLPVTLMPPIRLNLGPNPQCLMRKGHGPCPLYARQTMPPTSNTSLGRNVSPQMAHALCLAFQPNQDCKNNESHRWNIPSDFLNRRCVFKKECCYSHTGANPCKQTNVPR